MTKIRGHGKKIIWIIHIFGKQSSIHGFILSIKSTNQNGYNFHLVPVMYHQKSASTKIIMELVYMKKYTPQIL